MPPHPLSNFQIQNFNQKESRFNVKDYVNCKYVADFNYFSKAFIFLSPTSDGVPIAPFVTVTAAVVGRASANFSFVSSIITGITKKLLKQ